MRNILGLLSISLGIIACILVFTDWFNTPPLPIIIFALLSIIAALMGIKTDRITGVIGIILSLVSLGYLTYLFIGLGA